MPLDCVLCRQCKKCKYCEQCEMVSPWREQDGEVPSYNAFSVYIAYTAAIWLVLMRWDRGVISLTVTTTMALAIILDICHNRCLCKKL